MFSILCVALTSLAELPKGAARRNASIIDSKCMCVSFDAKIIQIRLGFKIIN